MSDVYNTVECRVQVAKFTSDSSIEVHPDLELGEVIKSLGIYIEYIMSGYYT